MNTKTIGDRLKELRVDSDLKQEILANEFGVSRSAIASYETGNCLPSLQVAIKYAEKFNVSLDWIVGKVKEKNLTLTEDTEKEIKITHNSNLNLTPAEIDKIISVLELVQANQK